MGLQHNPLLKYGFALAMVPAAILLRYALAPLLGPGYQVVTVFPIVIITAILAGRRPALLNAVLSSIAAAYSFSGVIDATILTSTALIILTALLAGWLVDVLHRVLNAAWQNEQQFRLLFTMAGAGNATIDPQTGKYTRVNQTFCEITGYSPEELLQLRFTDIIHPDDRQKERELFERAKQEKIQYASEKRYVRKDDSVRWVYEAASIMSDKDGNPSEAIGSVFDITERKLREMEIHRLNRTLRAISESSQAMMHATEEYSYLRQVCDIIVRDCGHTLVWIAYAENDPGKTLRPVAFSGFESAYLETFTMTWADSEQGRSPIAEAIRTGKPSLCINLQTDPCFGPWRDQALKRGYASAIALPVAAQKRTFGVLTIYSREADPFPPDEIKLLTELTIDLAFGVTALRLRAEEEKAKAVQKYFRSLFESAPGLYLVLEPDGFKIAAISDAYLRSTMTERADIMGKGLFEIFPDQPGEPLADGVRNLRASLEHVKASKQADVMAVQRYPIRRPDGTWEERWWSPINSPVFDPDGQIAYIIHRVEDVTTYVQRMQRQGKEGHAWQELERLQQHIEAEIVMRSQELQRLNNQLRESEERFRALATATSEVLYRMSADWSEMKQLQSGGFLASTDKPNPNWLTEYVHPDDQPRVTAAIQEAIRNKQVFQLEHRVRRADGSLGWTFSRAVPLLGTNGEIMEWFGAANDITERKRAEEELRKSYDRLKKVLDVQTVGVMFWDLVSGRLVYANDTFLQTMGYSRDELDSGELKWQQFTPPEYYEVSAQAVSDCLKTGHFGPYDKEYIRKDSTRQWFTFAGSLIDTDTAVEFCVDISERKRAEEAMLNAMHTAEMRTRQVEEREHILTAMMEHIPLGITIADAPDVTIRAVSRYGQELTGKPREQLEGISGNMHSERWQIYHADGVTPAANEELPLTRATQKGELVLGEEWTIVRSDGQVIPILCTAAPIRDDAGKITGGVIGWQDISFRKRFENELQMYQEKLENKNREMESLIGIVSHDLRAPLVNIQGFSSELKMDSEEVNTLLSEAPVGQKIEKQLDKLLHQNIPESIHYIETSAEAMNRLVAALVEVARAGLMPTKPETLDMNGLLKQILDSIEIRSKEAGVSYAIDDMPPCVADKTQVEQIFRNILDNAVKYLDPDRLGQICIGGKLESGSALYWIADNGIGISQEHLDKIFEPYYQLKEKASGGLGMGLVTVKRMVERNGGRIWVVSEKGKGSTFYVALPQKQLS